MLKPIKTLSILSILITGLMSADVEAKRSAVIQGYDAIIYPGTVVDLEVKVERARFFPTRVDLRKQKIHFTHKGMHLGATRSGKNGIARLKTVFYEPGLKIVKARLDSSKYQANLTDNRILVVERDAPILISDIDHTLADISGRDFLRTPDQEIPQLVRASEVVNRLKNKLNIAYMTARDDAFIKRTKNWLDINEFPKGPPFSGISVSGMERPIITVNTKQR